MNRNRKCTIYRIFKEAHCFEQYLTALNFVERRALCKFRTGNHRLPIVKARYLTGEIDVKCKLCNSSDQCDEFHTLFHCKYFEEKRKLLLKKYFYNRPNTYKMQLLFNNPNVKQLSNLAKLSRIIMAEF